MNLSEMELTWRGSPLAVPGEPGQGKIWGEYEGQRSKGCRAITVRGVAVPRCRGRHQPVAAAFPAQILGNFATAPGVEPHECADPSRGACAGVMSRRWLSTRGASGFAAHAARTQPMVGAPAVEPPKNSTWLSSAPAGTTKHMMSAAVTRRARAAGALKGPGAEKRPEQRPRSATCGRSPGMRSSSRRGKSGASSITGGLGVQR